MSPPLRLKDTFSKDLWGKVTGNSEPIEVVLERYVELEAIGGAQVLWLRVPRAAAKHAPVNISTST